MDDHRSKDKPKKRWIDCGKDKLSKNGVNIEMTTDRR